jgi:A/G-specific adenine glycosylase
MNDFSTAIRSWYRNNARDLPWRNTSDPYLIWLSEVILQQTRIEQGLPYYQKFADRFPEVTALANADEEEVLECWKGLGYYSRARNLHRASQIIRDEFDGQFPDEYNSLIQLPGVGEYTAAAVASFAFGERRAVVDGNVFRLLSRYLGIETPINTTRGKREFTETANELISSEFPAEHNQAIMEMGSLICLPQNPKCSECVLQSNCAAFHSGKVNDLPVKLTKSKSKYWTIHYAVSFVNDRLVFLKDPTNNVWKGLYQFPILKSELNTKSNQPHNSGFGELLATQKHVLSHRKILAHFYHIPYTALPKATKKNIFEFTMEESLDRIALTRLIHRFLEENQKELCQLIKSY